MKYFKSSLIASLFLISSTIFAQKAKAITTVSGKSITNNTVIGVTAFGASPGNDTLLIGQTIAVKMQTNDSLKEYKLLLINGMSVDGINVKKINCTDNVIYFELNESIRTFFADYIKDGSLNKITIPIKISVAKLSQGCISNGEIDQIIALKPKTNIYWIWAVALPAIALIIMGLYNNLLKDDHNVYYSLGRTQLFFWTIVFLVSYLYIWFKTESLPDITNTILIILGISVSTTAATKLVENQNNNKEADAEKNYETNTKSKGKSEGFFYDILSDGSSINIQRFQNVIFNLTFGIIFIQKAFSSHILPEFDSNALLLMGISSATYAGLKTTEVKNKQEKPNEDTAKVENSNITEEENVRNITKFENT
jgi:hypothetical protein